jgi:hypothetical protein
MSAEGTERTSQGGGGQTRKSTSVDRSTERKKQMSPFDGIVAPTGTTDFPGHHSGGL